MCPACLETSHHGARGTRTPDLLGAIQALSQLSYSPAGADVWPCVRRRESSRRKGPRRHSIVCRRMGLLDDAIRDHLELKRRRGADPGEVARAQREALNVVPEQPDEAVDADLAPEGV